VDFVLSFATSLLFLTFLLLLPSLLLVVASIYADFEFTILAGVLTFFYLVIELSNIRLTKIYIAQLY
jgi:hypothetical protein